MSSAWGSSEVKGVESELRAKRMIRLWGYLAIAGLFLMYVYLSIGKNLF